MDNGADIRNSPYAPAMEELCRVLLRLKPEKIGVCLLADNGDAACYYFGGCSPYDKMAMANHHHTDGLMAVVLANAGRILREGQEQEAQGDG